MCCLMAPSCTSTWGLSWGPGIGVWPVRPDPPGWVVVRGSPPVARSSSLTAQVLIALGPERLAELLLDLADSDPAIKRRIINREQD